MLSKPPNGQLTFLISDIFSDSILTFSEYLIIFKIDLFSEKKKKKDFVEIGHTSFVPQNVPDKIS